MRQVSTLNRLFLLSTTSVILWGGLARNAYAQNTGKPPSKSHAAYRLTMTECEGIDNCTTWTFLSSNGWKGYAKWRTGEEAILELESPGGGKITIHRTDVQGSKAGLTGTYNGTLRQDRLGGEFESHYEGHDESGNWYAIIGTASPTLPTVMHFCAQHCTTLIWDKDHFTNASDPGNAEWKVESFTSDSVLIRRTDFRPRPFNAVYSGRMSGESLVGNGWKITWGSALNTLPGCDAQRDGSGTCQQTQSAQITPGDVYAGAKAFRDGVLELKKWNDFFRIFRSNDDQ